MNLLLDYFFPIVTIDPTPAASTAFLKNVLAIVKPKVGATEDTPTLVTSSAGVDAFSTTNTEVDELFAGGMNRVWVMASDDLTAVGTNIIGKENEFFTILISSDFTDAEMDALAIGTVFKGVIGMASTDDAKNEARAVIKNRVAFHSASTNKAKNMFFTFGKLLSNSLAWRNQQYIQTPYADDVTTLGKANDLFDKKISFVMKDNEFGNRLGLLAAGGEAIVAPYILRNFQIDLQSATLTYVSGNQPAYTKVEAALIEDEGKKVIDLYISRGDLEKATFEVKLEQDNFVGSGYINVRKPRAYWRTYGEMRQTL